MNPDTISVNIPLSTDAGVSSKYRTYVRYKKISLVVLTVLLLIFACLSIMIGATGLSFVDVARAVACVGDERSELVVWSLRMPRVLTAIVAGVALSVAGCAFQSVLRNPLASASTLGISAGGALGASVAIVFLGAGVSSLHEGVGAANPYTVAICAFVGAMLSTVCILALAWYRDLSPTSIILAGVALGALFSGATAIIQYFGEDTQVAAIVFWTFGDLGRTTYREICIIAVVAIFAALFFFANRLNLNAIAQGEGFSHSLGVNVLRTRIASMLVGTLAASVAIAFCGTINFIGLVAPHIVRRFVGDDYRYLIPASALAGAIILLAADILARSILPGTILPISAITSFIGAPVFICLLMKGGPR